MTPATNNTVSHREGLTIGFYFHRKLRNDCAATTANLLRESGVLRRIKSRQPGTNHSNCAALGCKGPLMRGCVYPTRQPADHSETRVGKLIGKLLGRFHSIMGRAPRANDSDGVLIALGQLAPNVEHDGWRMDLAQLARIERRFRG